MVPRPLDKDMQEVPIQWLPGQCQSFPNGGSLPGDLPTKNGATTLPKAKGRRWLPREPPEMVFQQRDRRLRAVPVQRLRREQQPVHVGERMRVGVPARGEGCQELEDLCSLPRSWRLLTFRGWESESDSGTMDLPSVQQAVRPLLLHRVRRQREQLCVKGRLRRGLSHHLSSHR